jgi:hypothetical protein
LKKSALYRASCNSVELRLRTEPDGTGWLVITRPGAEASYVEIEDRDVPALVAEFEAIGNDVGRFNAFLSRVA